MSGYSIALFLHIIGALGIFVALGLEWTGLRQIRSARTLEPVLGWMGILKSTRKAGFISMLVAVLSGFYMLLTYWGWVAWLSVSIGSLVLVIVLWLVLTGPRMRAVGRALATEKGPVSATFHTVADHPLLWISIQARVAIIFLKIARPDLAGALFVVALAIVLGVVSALPMSRHERVAEGPAR